MRNLREHAGHQFAAIRFPRLSHTIHDCDPAPLLHDCVQPHSNSVALWLNMSPADVFVYAFFPPLLLDSAVRMDFFMLRKVRSSCRREWRGL